MIDTPRADAIIAAVAAWLRDGEEGADRFGRLVAANALSIAHRELAHAPADEARWTAELARLLGAQGDLAELTASLAARLRASDGTADEGVARYLWDVTMAKLAIDQPGYASYRIERTADAQGERSDEL